MKNQYTISEYVSNVYALILSKIFYPKARLIRRPVYIRGKKGLSFEEGLTTGHNCRFDLQGKKTLLIGKKCEIGDYVHIVAHEKVEIGNDVLIASKVFISDTDHGVYKGEFASSPFEKPNDRKIFTNPVKIGNNVWIGENAVILSGSVIGDGCIVGANSVVRGTFENGQIIAGVPAKTIKKWDQENNKWEREE